jgi:hypothetical protein
MASYSNERFKIHKGLLEGARSRGLSFQMDVASLPHAKLMQAIKLIGTRVAPILRTSSKNP